MEENSKPIVQPQRRLNPKVQDVIKTEIVKLLDAGLIYAISDSPWVSPIHVVPKKGGITVIANKDNELILTRTVTGWRVCINYRKLNDATRKDHFPLPFIDQMLERLSGNEYYCFLDGFSGYFQIPLAPEDQEKTTFTCPYGTFAYRRMPFGLCNAPATFQRCMTTIFHDMCKDFMEVFMDDFSVFGNSFGTCFRNLLKMLARCEETNLVLNWEKCHFMVKERIVLGHKISKAGIVVDKAKVDVIASLPHLNNVKGIRSFLGHAGFYRRFIKDFSKIARPMTQLLMKDAKFDFSDECIKSFDILRDKLITALVIIAPNWDIDFELMCDASDYAVGAVLGQRVEKKLCPIYYASKTMNNAQEHYTTTEKELLTVVYAFDKFRFYLTMSKTVVYIDHTALKYLFSKQDAKRRLIRWVLLLQEFTIEIKDKKGTKNLAADHLSRIENPGLEELNEDTIQDNFHDEHLMVIKLNNTETDPWHADYANFLVSKIVTQHLTYYLRKKILNDVRKYIWDDPYLFKSCLDGIIRRCVFGRELHEILEHCHKGPTGGHYEAYIIARNIFESGFYWPAIFKDAAKYVQGCDACQWAGNISSQNQMPLTNILVRKHRFLQLNQLDEFWTDAYEHSRAYKERTKRWHDSKIIDKEFQEGEEVLVFNSRLKLFPRKLRTKWYGPYTVSKVYPYGTVEVLGNKSSISVDPPVTSVEFVTSVLAATPCSSHPTWGIELWGCKFACCSSEEQKDAIRYVYSWVLIHSRKPDDMYPGVNMLKGSVESTKINPKQKKQEMYLLAVGYFRNRHYTESEKFVSMCLELYSEGKKSSIFVDPPLTSVEFVTSILAATPGS
ncbi:putative nucleotidyltransferase, ribonuclease H [Tanacetum coccineum]|uniref:Nucleotidyltransferase, ribonuclease H n=1 Tax=Tanacetum coccineum TaxID=301880 RepID=A0ABQ5FN43_9ASTR